jgi:hypothetical protein
MGTEFSATCSYFKEDSIVNNNQRAYKNIILTININEGQKTSIDYDNNKYKQGLYLRDMQF